MKKESDLKLKFSLLVAITLTIFIIVLGFISPSFGMNSTIVPDRYSLPAPDDCNSCQYDIAKFGIVYITTHEGCTEVFCLTEAETTEPEIASDSSTEPKSTHWLQIASNIYYENQPDAVNMCINGYKRHLYPEYAKTELNMTNNEIDNRSYVKTVIIDARKSCVALHEKITQELGFSENETITFMRYISSRQYPNWQYSINGQSAQESADIIADVFMSLQDYKEINDVLLNQSVEEDFFSTHENGE